MLSFHREMRKADTQEKYLELVTILVSFPGSSFHQLQYVSKAMKAGSVRTWELLQVINSGSVFQNYIFVLFATFRCSVAKQSYMQGHDEHSKPSSVFPTTALTLQ